MSRGIEVSAKVSSFKKLSWLRKLSTAFACWRKAARGRLAARVVLVDETEHELRRREKKLAKLYGSAVDRGAPTMSPVSMPMLDSKMMEILQAKLVPKIKEAVVSDQLAEIMMKPILEIWKPEIVSALQTELLPRLEEALQNEKPVSGVDEVESVCSAPTTQHTSPVGDASSVGAGQQMIAVVTPKPGASGAAESKPGRTPLQRPRAGGQKLAGKRTVDNLATKLVEQKGDYKYVHRSRLEPLRCFRN